MRQPTAAACGRRSVCIAAAAMHAVRRRKWKERIVSPMPGIVSPFFWPKCFDTKPFFIVKTSRRKNAAMHGKNAAMHGRKCGLRYVHCVAYLLIYGAMLVASLNSAFMRPH